MPRRFFRKFSFKRDEVHGRWFMAPFRHLLHESRLWSIRRRTVVPAFSLGLFVAFFPLPGHFAWAAVLAILLRVNLPVAAVTTLVSNPLTMAPMYYGCYQVGRWILDRPPQPFAFEMSMAWLGDQFLTIWQPMLLGCLLVGSWVALIGYIGLDVLWRASIADYLEKRRRKKAAEAMPD